MITRQFEWRGGNALRYPLSTSLASHSDVQDSVFEACDHLQTIFNEHKQEWGVHEMNLVMVGTSGVIMGTLMASYDFNCPVHFTQIEKKDSDSSHRFPVETSWHMMTEPPLNVFVDDLISTGDTLKLAQNRMKTTDDVPGDLHGALVVEKFRSLNDIFNGRFLIKSTNP